MKKDLRTILRYAFTVIEGLVFISLLLDSIINYMDYMSRNVLCYVAVVFAAFISFFLTPLAVHRQKGYLLLAFIFILGADALLIFTDGIASTIGVFLFMPAQICIAYFIHGIKTLGLNIGISLIVSGVVMLIVKNTDLGDNLDFLQTFAALLYYIILVTNIITSLIVNKKKEDYQYRHIFIIGLFFLLLCDTSIGVYNLTGLPIFNSLIWLFYIPFLVLMTNYLTINAKKDTKSPTNAL